MENPRDPQRAQSLDRSHVPRKNSESSSCQCLSLPSMPYRRAPRRAISDGARCSQSPDLLSGAQDAEATAAHTLEETREFLPSEQRPPPDTKKDKAQRRAQQGWLKMVLNFLLRTGFEEPKDKASRRPKGKEEPPESPEAAEELALRKKGQDKKASRKKYGHRKHGAEEGKENRDREAGGHQARLPKMAAALYSEEAEVAPVRRGGRDSSGHHSLPSEGAGAGLSDISPRATGSGPEEEHRKPNQDDVIQMIVEFLKKVGDQWEEEVRSSAPASPYPFLLHPVPLKLLLLPLGSHSQAPQSEVPLQNPALGCRRKSQEKKPSSLKRVFSLKNCSPEEPRRVGAASVPSPEARPPKRPSFLPLCIGGGGHRPSTSGSPDGDGPSASELPACAGCQGPKEELPLDRASESNEFMRKILALLRDEEPAGEQQPQVQEAEAAGESLALGGRRKSQEKKPSSLRRAFSHKRHSSKEPKRAGAVGTGGAATPEPRPPKRPSFLPLCVSGHRASVPCSSGCEDLSQLQTLTLVFLPSDKEGPEFQEPSAAEGAAPAFSEAASRASSCTPDGGPQLPQEGACESKELIIRKLVVLLQEVDSELGKQIRRHPSFKRFFYEFSDSSLRKLVATLRSQQARRAAGDRSLPERLFPLAFGLGNKYADSHSRTICSLMGSRGHYGQHGGAQAQSREAQPNLTSPECQSPD
ncbi:protein BNIP5 [Erethizon dorsatum]